ncbi:histidine kinase [Amycolatopsis regifaucium]|uniref:histidine kinase n=1 Tax=Amycolatopsis regifaucium TaxID=546365 RepID=A0A154MJN3_9PSEU|nr:histidine kinase [Amycolatopsis regifaucium]KZB83639.1 histidine kinase [Amycolatopsis regifaucium]OKA03843.1 two-component sensor histidine kinase [Amycolatopsis regifaucium]SFJ66444.1 Signal transduction histidine kinase [Amycolatopsis regifaucium]
MEKSRPFRPGPADTFWLTVAALAFVGLDIALYVFGDPTTGWAGPAAGVTLQVLLDLSLLLLFRFPRLIAGLVLAGALLMLASDLLSPGLLVPERQLTLMTVPSITPVVLSQLARLMDRRTLLWLTAVLVVCASRPWDAHWNTTPFGLLSTALPTTISLYFEARRQLLRSLRDRAERAEREQHLLAERARAEERRKLAEEMHDVVTHRLSLMVLHAGALGVVSSDEAVRTSAEDIRREGALALDELRDLVGVLRNGANAGPRTLTDGTAGDPATLVAESRSVGIPTELTVHGDPGRISPTVARTAYRVVQEALTNIRKHAPGSTATVALRYHAEGLDIAVANTRAGAPADPALAGSGSGAGLAGLRQRVELIGGRFDAGPIAGGGYRVDAILPAYVPTTEGDA